MRDARCPFVEPRPDGLMASSGVPGRLCMGSMPRQGGQSDGIGGWSPTFASLILWRSVAWARHCGWLTIRDHPITGDHPRDGFQPSPGSREPPAARPPVRRGGDHAGGGGPGQLRRQGEYRSTLAPKGQGEGQGGRTSGAPDAGRGRWVTTGSPPRPSESMGFGRAASRKEPMTSRLLSGKRKH